MTTVLPRRLAAGSPVPTPADDRRVVHDQQALLALPPGCWPVLTGPGPFALGHGAVAELVDGARCCVLEGAVAHATGAVDVAVWAGGTVHAQGPARADVGPGGRLRLRCDGPQRAGVQVRPRPLGVATPSDVVDPPHVQVHGAVDVVVSGGTVEAAGGARVEAHDAAVVVHDPTVQVRTVEGRWVQVRRGEPAGALPAPAPRPAPPADRRVLLPWGDLVAALDELLDGAPGDPWEQVEGVGQVRRLHGPLPASVTALELPPGLAHEARDGGRLVGDGVRVLGRRRPAHSALRRLLGPAGRREHGRGA